MRVFCFLPENTLFMQSQIKPNKDSSTSKKDQVRDMFDNISSSYDKTNSFISVGLDKRWKKRLVKLVLDIKPHKVLDLATGTADLPIRMVQQGMSSVTGLDLSPKMLMEGQKRVDILGLSDKITLIEGESENLPFDDNSFDAVSVSYGLRNYEDLNQGLLETLRVLKSGGTFIILETSVPQHFPFKQGYTLFSKHIMPFIGQMFSGDKAAYEYLSESAENFPCGEELVAILSTVGFVDIIVKPQFFGAASIYVARKR